MENNTLSKEWRYFDLHGLLLFVAWNLLSFALIGSVRWFKNNWKVSTQVHVISGVIIAGLTVWLAIRACLYLKAARIEANVHSIIGLFMLVMIVFPVISGFIVLYNRTYKTWSKEKWLSVRKAHKWVGYLLVVCGFIECASGLVEYYKEIDP